MALFAFAAAGAVTIAAVALIVLALVFYLSSIVLALRRIASGLAEVLVSVREMVRKSAPVNGVVKTINEHLDTGVNLLEGLLVKKAGVEDAIGLVEGLYPGSAAAGFRHVPASRTTSVPEIGEVYPRGAITLERLGREATVAAETPPGPELTSEKEASDAAATLDPEGPSSPLVGPGAPIRYGPSPPDTISWGRAAPEAQAAAPEPESAAPESEPAPPDEPKTISWKRS